MTDEIKYEDKIQEAADQKRDADVVLSPTMNHLKKAFSAIFGDAGFNGSDFKRLSDFMYYQGGYPSPDTPPKESNLAYQVAQIIKLEVLLEKDGFLKYMNTYGVDVCIREMEVKSPDDDYKLSKDDEKDLLKHWQGAGIDQSIPGKRSEALRLLLDKGQKIEGELCETKDFLKELSETVEEKFGIRKSNFMKAVQLAVIKMKKGEGAMGEKLDAVVDGAENLIKAVEPLLKS